MKHPVLILLITTASKSLAFPNVCSVVKTPAFRGCLELSIQPSMCGWPIPRPCAHFSYYVPVTFIESVSNPRETFFYTYPGIKPQLSSIKNMKPFGAEDDKGAFSFHAHALTVPLVSLAFRAMPCGDLPTEHFCFEAMSEHVDLHWRTGRADLFQPQFLAWKASPKACLLAGAVTSVSGEMGSAGGSAPICSFQNPLATYPPSPRHMCNGWGTFYPRYGTYDGASQTVGALVIADRLKSIGTEVFHSVPASGDEKWQMIIPTQSACFRRGQNVGVIETAGMATDIGRISSGRIKNYLFTVWKRVSCTKDIPTIASTNAAVAMMKPICQGVR